MNGDRTTAELMALAEYYSPPCGDALPYPADLVPVDLSDVMTSKPARPRFIMEPWLPRRLVALLGAHGGFGKTITALTAAAHVASGIPFLGLEVEQARVVFASLEDEPELIRYRLRLIIEEYDLNPFKVLDNITMLDGTSGYAALITEGIGSSSSVLLTAAYKSLAEQSAGAGLIIVDNASDAFDANENQRRHVRGFIRALADIARDNDAAVLLLAHIDKQAARIGSQGNSYSGSTAWHNSCRSRLAILADDGLISIHHEKNNLGPKADPVSIAFSDKGIPIRAMPTGGPSRESQDRQDLVRCFKVAAQAGITIPDNVAPGAYSAMAALSNLAEYPKHFQAQPGKRSVPKLITAMMRDGLLKSEQYDRPNRKKGQRLVLTTGAKTEASCP